MSTSEPRDILKVPGKLVAELGGQTLDLTTSFPWGGTSLGVTRSNAFRFGIRVELIEAEEFGGATVDGVYAGEAAVLAGVLRSYDSDALGLIFPKTSTGSATGQVVLEPSVTTDGTRAGQLLATRSVKLVFSPRAADDHPFIYFPRAMPSWSDAAEIQNSLNAEWGFEFAFIALPGPSGRPYVIGHRGDFAL